MQMFSPYQNRANTPSIAKKYSFERLGNPQEKNSRIVATISYKPLLVATFKQLLCYG